MPEVDSVVFHEDRINRLEVGMQENSKQLAGHTVLLENIQNTVQDMRLDIEKTIEKGFNDIRQDLKKQGEQVDNLMETVSNNTGRLVVIESSEVKRQHSRDNVWKALKFVGTAIVTLAMKALWDYGMIHWIH